MRYWKRSEKSKKRPSQKDIDVSFQSYSYDTYYLDKRKKLFIIFHLSWITPRGHSFMTSSKMVEEKSHISMARWLQMVFRKRGDFSEPMDIHMYRKQISLFFTFIVILLPWYLFLKLICSSIWMAQEVQYSFMKILSDNCVWFPAGFIIVMRLANIVNSRRRTAMASVNRSCH